MRWRRSETPNFTLQRKRGLAMLALRPLSVAFDTWERQMLNEMEKRIAEMLLAGEADLLAVLRTQLKGAVVARRELTGLGFFTHLSVPDHLPRLVGRQRLVIGDVYSDVTDLQHPAGFLLFVTDGSLDALECFIVDARWPDTPSLRRTYYVHPSQPGSANLVETEERDLGWALRDAVQQGVEDGRALRARRSTPRR